jgi:hypothetical protein
MFFKKKKEELSDQFAVIQKRKDPRYALSAGITIEGFEGEALLGNISVSGCFLESITYVGLKPTQIYKAKIIPNPEDGIEAFNLSLELNWTKSSEAFFEAGFSLGDGKTSPQLERYVKLLHSRGVQPSLGNANDMITLEKFSVS